MAWSGDASSYSDAQYESACVLDRKACGDSSPPKTRCSLPIKAPGSDTVDPEGLAAAAQRFPAVKACPAAKAAAAARLRSAYKALGKDPPDSIKASTPRMSFDRGTREWLLSGR